MAPENVKAATDAITELGRFADRCRITSPAMTAANVPAHEKASLLGDIATVDTFLGRLVVLLSEPTLAVR